MHEDTKPTTLLERDLTALAAPSGADEDLRLALRRRLIEQAETQPRRSRWALRPQRQHVVLAAGLAAAAATAAVALLGVTGSGGPGTASAAVLHRALGAITPQPNLILHVKLVDADTGEATVETWRTTSPPYSFLKTSGGDTEEVAVAPDGVAQVYDPDTNTIFSLSGVKDGASSLFSDPFAEVRRELRSGTAAVVGEATIDGRKAYEIRLDEQTIGYFDESTYLPLRLDRSRGGAVVARSRVAVYEYLPATEANLRLLSLQNRHPGARVEAKPGPEVPGKP